MNYDVAELRELRLKFGDATDKYVKHLSEKSKGSTETPKKSDIGDSKKKDVRQLSPPIQKRGQIGSKQNSAIKSEVISECESVS